MEQYTRDQRLAIKSKELGVPTWELDYYIATGKKPRRRKRKKEEDNYDTEGAQ